MRDAATDRLAHVLGLLTSAARALVAATDARDALERIAELCAGSLASYCRIDVKIEAIDPISFRVESGTEPVDAPVAACALEWLSAGRSTFGQLHCVTDDPEGFSPEMRQTLQVLALQLSLALAGYASVLRERDVADRFARSLLPTTLPAAEGLAFSAAYRPAGEDTQIGGDWYDAFALPDGRIAISVGDVAGHGLDAAVIMGEVRQAMRTAAVAAAKPSEVLEYVNSAIRLRDSIGMVTAIFGFYDPTAGVLTYASAGHPPPILALPGGFARRLPLGGVPLGCAVKVESFDWTFTLARGATLVLYTDGLIENDRDLDRGERQLIAAVCALGDEAGDRAEALLDRVFQGATNRDDAAVLMLATEADVASYVFSAVPAASPLARAMLDRALEAFGLDCERRFGVLVAVGEAIANAVEHAYRDAEPGLIHVHLRHEPNTLEITIEDNGRWRAFVKSEERGRGFDLMHAYTDGVQVRTASDSTVVVLRIACAT